MVYYIGKTRESFYLHSSKRADMGEMGRDMDR